MNGVAGGRTAKRNTAISAFGGRHANAWRLTLGKPSRDQLAMRVAAPMNLSVKVVKPVAMSEALTAWK